MAIDELRRRWLQKVRDEWLERRLLEMLPDTQPSLDGMYEVRASRREIEDVQVRGDYV
jgi:hypothetical protein